MKNIWLIIIGIVIVLVIIWLIGGNSISSMLMGNTPTPTPAAMQQISPSPEAMAPANTVYQSANDPKLGAIMTDSKGMTLYTFDKDTTGVSNCSGQCEVNWPVYAPTGADSGTLPENITVITRADGTKQYAWKGMPLYYYIKDTKAGDTTGDGVGGTWHVVNLTAATSPTTTTPDSDDSQY
jgi:predicted lipoprotein with Yx(FWY)xxD motif